MDLGIIGNDKISHTPEGSRTGASQSDAVKCHTQDTPLGEGSYSSVGDG